MVWPEQERRRLHTLSQVIATERSNPNLIFASIAHQLGRIFPLFGEKLADVLQSNPYLASASVPFQLEEFIIKPLQSLRDSLNLCLIVIDALDECKDTGTTSIILSSLSRRVLELSPLEILVTSRPEQSIVSVFASRSGHLNSTSGFAQTGVRDRGTIYPSAGHSVIWALHFCSNLHQVY